MTADIPLHQQGEGIVEAMADYLWRKRIDAVSPWNSAAPIRADLFSVERLEQQARTLAAEQGVAMNPKRVPLLTARLRENEAVLLAAYRSSAATLEAGTGVVPAAEWLLDNYHLVEEQIHEIRDDLPPGCYRQLPKLAAGPFAGYPRVFGIAWAFVAHTDSHFEPEMLRRFVDAYQEVQLLTVGELWATAITLRIVPVENLRRLATQITEGQDLRATGDALADRLLGAQGRPPEPVAAVLGAYEQEPLPELLAGQLAQRLRDQTPQVTPAEAWLDARLERQGSSAESAVHNAHQRQGASNVSVRNVVTGMRAVSDTDWAAWFESVSAVDARLRRDGAFGAMDFATRNLYRSAVEDLARGSGLAEVDVAEESAAAAGEEPAGNPGFHFLAGGRGAFERAIGFRPRLRSWPARASLRLGLGGYAGSLLGLGALLLALALWAALPAGRGLWTPLLLALAGPCPCWTPRRRW